MSNQKKSVQEEKTIITRDEFFAINANAANEMHKDKELQRKAREVLIEADRHRWIHQATWFGEPLLNLPQDMFAVQEIIWRTRPDYIVEVGVAWGGSVLFEACLLEILGGKKVIGVDVFIPDDLRARLAEHGKISERLDLIQGGSTEPATLDKVKALLGGSDRVMVILDSYHTHEHVLKELRAYSPLVKNGQYLLCGDTIVEHIPAQTHRVRPWGPNNNPATAVKEFLSETDRFEVDFQLDQRLLLSCHPGGYLRAVK